MNADMQQVKANIRATMLARREGLSSHEALTHSAAILHTVSELPVFTDASTISCYLAIGNEVQTAELINLALAQGKVVALPRTVMKERRLVLHRVDDLKHLIPGPYGILEPAADMQEVNPEDIETFFVPGVAFDAMGNRIGYGGGFYDSLLSARGGWRVALAYAWQIVPQIVAGEHDVPVDVLVTEVGTIDCARARTPADHLRLRNMIFYGHHGVSAEERAEGRRISVDVDLRLDLQTPGLTDDLATTIDYPSVYHLINRIQSGNEFALIETLAEKIANAILHDFPPVVDVTVRASKCNPPIGGLADAFEVEIVRSRMRLKRR